MPGRCEFVVSALNLFDFADYPIVPQTIDSLEIRPSGAIDRLKKLAASQFYSVLEGKSIVPTADIRPTLKTIGFHLGLPKWLDCARVSAFFVEPFCGRIVSRLAAGFLHRECAATGGGERLTVVTLGKIYAHDTQTPIS
jgi:hypothetical protein